MKFKTAFILLTTALFLMLSGCAGGGMQTKKFTTPALTASDAFRPGANFFDCLGKPVLFKKGDTLPLKLTVNNPYLGLSAPDTRIRVLKSFYILYEIPKKEQNKLKSGTVADSAKKQILGKMKIFFSNNGTRWAPLGSMRNLKKVFGINSGALAFSLHMKEGEGLQAGLILSGQ